MAVLAFRGDTSLILLIASFLAALFSFCSGDVSECDSYPGGVETGCPPGTKTCIDIFGLPPDYAPTTYRGCSLKVICEGIAGKCYAPFSELINRTVACCACDTDLCNTYGKTPHDYDSSIPPPAPRPTTTPPTTTPDGNNPGPGPGQSPGPSPGQSSPSAANSISHLSSLLAVLHPLFWISLILV